MLSEMRLSKDDVRRRENQTVFLRILAEDHHPESG